jgi:hypothetical protein
MVITKAQSQKRNTTAQAYLDLNTAVGVPILPIFSEALKTLNTTTARTIWEERKDILTKLEPVLREQVLLRIGSDGTSLFAPSTNDVVQFVGSLLGGLSTVNLGAHAIPHARKYHISSSGICQHLDVAGPVCPWKASNSRRHFDYRVPAWPQNVMPRKRRFLGI